MKKSMSNKLFYTLVVFGAIILMGVGVFAWTAGGSGNPGHNIDSIGAPSGCTDGKYLRFNEDIYTGDQYWSCGAPQRIWSGSSSDAYLNGDVAIGKSSAARGGIDLEVGGKTYLGSTLNFADGGTFYLRDYAYSSGEQYTDVFKAWGVSGAWGSQNTKVGANKYCDLSGTNCFAPSDIELPPMRAQGSIKGRGGGNLAYPPLSYGDFCKVYFSSGIPEKYSAEFTFYQGEGSKFYVKTIHQVGGISLQSSPYGPTGHSIGWYLSNYQSGYPVYYFIECFPAV